MSQGVQDVVVIGGGLAGLVAAFQIRRARPDASIRILERQPQPGGRTRTMRIEGFVCETGPLAFRVGAQTRALFTALALDDDVVRSDVVPTWRGPTPDVMRLLTESMFDGEDGPLLSFRGGCEDLIQALRRELAGSIWAARPAEAIERTDDGGYRVQLGGLVRSQIATRELVLATPPAAAGELLADVDRDLAEALCEVRMLSATNVYLGFRDHDARDALTGGGFVQQEHGEDPFLAAFDCGQWFPRRGVVGKSVVRVVLDGDLLPFDRDPERLATAAETALRGYCDLAGPLLMRRVVHAFDAIPRAASLTRLTELRTSVRERLGITLT